jgi:hypothetical protein
VPNFFLLYIYMIIDTLSLRVWPFSKVWISVFLFQACFSVVTYCTSVHTCNTDMRRLTTGIRSCKSVVRQFLLFANVVMCTDMRRLTKGIHYEKYVVRRFRCCANAIECTYTNLDSIAYYAPRLYDIVYCS